MIPAIPPAMPPKKAPSIPLGDVVEIVTETKRTRRGLRSTEKEVPVRSLKEKKPGQASRPKSQSCKKTVTKQVNTPGHISSDGETIPLKQKAVQEDILEDQGDHDEAILEGYADAEEHTAAENVHGQGNV